MSNFTKLMQQAASGVGGTEPFYDYEIENSAHFEPLSSTYARLDRTIGSGSNTTWSWSMWVKPPVVLPSSGYANTGQLGVNSATVDTALRMTNNLNGSNAHKLWPYGYNSGYLGQDLSAAQFRDPSAWYHILWVVDTTESAEADRCKIYINGVQTPLNQFTYSWPLNGNTGFGISGNNMYITRYGYVAEVILLDGTATTPTSFGEFKNGVWVPIDPAAQSYSYGTNGFWLDFANSSNLGNDVSGNGNHFTASNMSSTNQKIDTPTNNFATWNPLKLRDTASAYWPLESYSEGNLTTTHPSSVSSGTSYTTVGVPADTKMYCEIYVSALGGGSIGIDSGSYGNTGSASDRYLYASGGSISGPSSSTSGSSYTTGDIIGICIDRVSDEVAFYKNGSLQGTLSGLSDKPFFPFFLGNNNASRILNAGQNGTFNGNVTAGGNTDANGLGDFKYTVPTDALALCTANLPEPTIGPNSATLSGENFNNVIYIGNGTTKSITGVGFQPDFTWIKQRTDATTHNVFDAVRGVYKNLKTDTSDAEGYNTNTLSSFDADGFTVGSANAVNGSGDNLVAWNWKANGSGVSNTDGTITSTVSANQDAGISIVTYTGNGTAGSTIGHGLGIAPAMVIVKSRSYAGTSWCVSHVGYPTTQNLYLDENLAVLTRDRITARSTNTFTVGSHFEVNNVSDTYVAYAFAEVEGFSSFGSYTGNGSTDGPMIFTGMRPAFVIVKRTDSTGSWYIYDTERDPYNVMTEFLKADLNDAEGTSVGTWDYLSNGFKLRNSNAAVNGSGATYIYMAFAENPFKYANAR